MLTSAMSNAKKAAMFMNERGNIYRLISRRFVMSNTENGGCCSLTKTTIRKMKVSQLRMELERRGLPCDGLRADLVQNLLNELFGKHGCKGKDKGDVTEKPCAESILVDPNILHVLRFKGDSDHLTASASFGAVLYNTETANIVWKGRLYLRDGESTQEAEYTGLKRSLQIVYNFGVRQLILQGNNTSTVVKHLTASYRVKAKNLKKLLNSVRSSVDQLEHCEVWGINPSENKKAASLSRTAMKTRVSEGFEAVQSLHHNLNSNP